MAARKLAAAGEEGIFAANEGILMNIRRHEGWYGWALNNGMVSLNEVECPEVSAFKLRSRSELGNGGRQMLTPDEDQPIEIWRDRLRSPAFYLNGNRPKNKDTWEEMRTGNGTVAFLFRLVQPNESVEVFSGMTGTSGKLMEVLQYHQGNVRIKPHNGKSFSANAVALAVWFQSPFGAFIGVQSRVRSEYRVELHFDLKTKVLEWDDFQNWKQQLFNKDQLYMLGMQGHPVI